MHAGQLHETSHLFFVIVINTSKIAGKRIYDAADNFRSLVHKL